jgi:amino acid adenylation domain-containing protein/thioester reductase-like protein
MSCLNTALQSLADALDLNEHTPAMSLLILPESERRHLLDGFNTTREDYPQGRLIHQLFEDQVRRLPSAVAMTHGERSVTYAELNAAANRLARFLRKKGVGPDKLVGLCVERSPQMVVGLLGIWKAGGAYVPLDPNYPRERLAYMLEDSKPEILLTLRSLRNRLPEMRAEVVVFEDNQPDIDAYPESDLPPDAAGVTARNLSYVIYTSGSTGEPKGVMLEHAGLCNLAYMQAQRFGVGPNSRILQFASLSFDACTWDCVMALCSGACLCLASRDELSLGEPLLRTLGGQRITHATLPPVALGASPPPEGLELSTLVVAGEACSPALVQAWGPGRRFFNAYGPTEGTVCATMQECEPQESGIVPIGRPIANARLYILDVQCEPVPIGVAGEIYIGGAGVARGYLNRPELTAKKFLCDPFSAEAGARMYKSGDLGRWNSNGTIEYLGRNDDQVKIRGFRIELGEIETQLVRHPLVKETVVLLREDVPGEKYLAAYVIPHNPCDAALVASAESLRAHLKSVLPDHMVPSAFATLERLPVTPNGKLDRRALPAPDRHAHVSRHYEPPLGHIEERLAGIWCELLGVERVGRFDHFFELGGHSLVALKASLRINQSLGSALGVSDIYRSPTLEELAARISGVAMVDELVELPREAALEEGIRARSSYRPICARAVLVTGCTGFVGRFLLAQLLKDTDARLYCLVRAASPNEAAARLKNNLLKWDLWREDYERRLIAIAGDLSLPRLGIDKFAYELLSDELDAIYHCATSMNHLETYAMAKPTNVEGLRELLWLAVHERPKLINYISTVGVFSSLGLAGSRTVDEESAIDFERHPVSEGYAASKWVGEKLIQTAGQRGIPCNVFRLGLVWADAQQGRYDELQREYRLIKSCLLAGGAIRNYRYEMAPTPVDHVARAVVWLADQHSGGKGIFHLFSSRQVHEGVFERCNEIAGTQLELMSAGEWVGEIKRLQREGQSLPMAPLIDSTFASSEGSGQEPEARAVATHFDCSRTYRELEKGGIFAPAFDDNLLGITLRGMLTRDEELRRGSVMQTAEQARRRYG